ncbi:serine/threonine-protein phosphatase 6 regulatory ankyrin repeat subunit [Thalictrum thalictroides]|uniref:Serine/threonine-protein phosphatase 6 regulatory ankyrin repeat subunit n=1 Tax=Thalictrum thalictroides TaxID=46969 RepID=A0A7J6XAH3_THATH|nr:serine/threonine-protein phosphatase 6 regulatory ankyrin repeat subunit [Thalictrum thalictroides]
MLAEKTVDIPDVAYASALEGRIVSLAALLMVVPEKVMASNMVLKPFGRFVSTEATTIYECVIGEALHLGLKGGSVKGVGLLSNSERRNLLLCEIELLQLLGATIPARSFSTDPQSISPLILASQAGDEQVLELLLKTKIDVNETDREGNSAVSSFLKSSSNAQNLGILSLLMKHGANVSQKNSFGLIPLHIAAANGYCRALQILLHKDPSSVDAVSKMQETPLFFAVKNDLIDCVQILLSSGANTQIFNLRKQRPVDLAKSQDMWFLLNQTIGFWSQPIQFKESTGWLNGCQSNSNAEILEPFFDSQMEIVSANVKTGTCKYLESQGGCIGAAECLYEHTDPELVWGKIQHHELKQEMQRAVCPSTDELKRKIFFGGLSPYKNSETLQNFLEDQFGTVENVVVITDQAGDRWSRGVGLIKCKNKESVVAEVQRHYVNLWGKKVVIIGAVFKHNLVSDIPRSTTRDQHFQGTVDSNEVHSAETRDEPMFWAGSLLQGRPRHQPHVKIDLTPKDQSVPTWTTTFRKWFPEFLRDVTMRREDGKWYPLCALKTDFSANCCLELDHASIGYPKLSDFIGSCPDICHMMKVVAGSGCATHIILLPADPSPTEQYKFCQLMEEPHAYSDSPSVVENDDIDSGFRCIYDTITATAFGNFSHAGSGEGTSSGSARNGKQDEEGKNNTSYPAPQLPLPGGSDPNFNANPQPRNHGGGEGEDGQGGQGNINPLLMAIQPGEFTYFTRQPEFFKKYREYLARNLCFKCGKNNMLWANHPCGHLLWCGDCMQWVIEQKLVNRTCVICDAKVDIWVLENVAYPPLGA